MTAPCPGSLAGFVSFALVGLCATQAGAQPDPARIVLTDVGDLYVVQDGNAVDLVPGGISDSEMAALNPNGEVQGTLVMESGAPIVFAPRLPAQPRMRGGAKRPFARSILRLPPQPSLSHS